MKPEGSKRMLHGAAYRRYLLAIAGMGGLLYGIDVGIIAAALLYLGKTVNLTLSQQSVLVAAVLGGSMVSSLVAGLLADWLGRKTMMIVSGFLFVGSVGIIVLSQGFVPLLAGRLLQGMSGGVIAVVVPLYLAECLAPEFRGRGSAIFQLMLTIGIVIAAAVGLFYTGQAESAIAAAHGNAALILAAQNHAWRSMFLAVIYPGVIFFAGAFFLGETPRWLFRKGRRDQAMQELLRTSLEPEAQLQFREMEALAARGSEAQASGGAGSLLQRKYVVPFVLACIILACNQATGINSILGYLVIILKQAGMTAQNATRGDLAVKLLNVVMTLVAVALVDKKGRKFLLVVGTAGVIISLGLGALLFRSFESQRTDLRDEVQAHASDTTLDVPLNVLSSESNRSAKYLLVVYDFCNGLKSQTVLTTDSDPAVHIARGPSIDNPITPCHLHIDHAFLGPVPSERTGWLVALCLALFISAFAVGPGVVVWLALSELMPTRIRSAGMGIALTLNGLVSTAIAGVFLPVVGNHGYAAMFAFWALCTVVYFITAAFFLPETKGRTLEEIEQHFERS